MLSLCNNICHHLLLDSSCTVGCQMRLLEHSLQHSVLYELLEILDLREADILMKVIIPNLDTLPPAAVNKALAFLVSHWETLKSNEALLEMLSAACFVTAGELVNIFE